MQNSYYVNVLLSEMEEKALISFLLTGINHPVNLLSGWRILKREELKF